jgi:iron(III) transport system ATP-binding protein
MYLGDRWEYVFRPPGEESVSGMALRAYGQESRAQGEHRLALPASQMWIFSRPA